MRPLALLSVDLDGLSHYGAIHGLGGSVDFSGASRLLADKAIPRLLSLFEKASVAATFFVIGAEATEKPMREALRLAHLQGIELSSHSHSHDYRLSRLSTEAIRADLTLAHDTISSISGVPVVGFRAPGYTLSSALLGVVEDLGYLYDSSAFPAAPYYMAKASVMAGLALAGRPSRAVLDVPQVVLAPRTPYHPNRRAPYRFGNSPLWEFPISVTPKLRLPFIGTFVTASPWPLVERALHSLSTQPVINFEMHAIDVLDESDGIPRALVRRQRDLAIPAQEKLTRLERIVSSLHATREVLTFREAAAMLH
jgi:peptidoglycan-N-acetylglucosamine deacetylase